VFFRLTDEEFENLEKYCQLTQRSKSDVFRELIRSLKVKKSGSPELVVIILPNQRSKLIRDS